MIRLCFFFPAFFSMIMWFRAFAPRVVIRNAVPKLSGPSNRHCPDEGLRLVGGSLQQQLVSLGPGLSFARQLRADSPLKRDPGLLRYGGPSKGSFRGS